MVLFGRNRGVGVEVDSGVVRVVEVNGSGDNFSITAVGSEKLPPDAVTEGVVEQAEQVTQTLYRLWREGGFSAKDVVLGMCTQGMFMRIISFPAVPEDRLGDALRLQADEHFPFPADELIIDYEVLDEVVDDEGESALQILLVAVRREHVTPCLQAVTDAGLSVGIVDAASLALIRSAQLSVELNSGAVALCNIGGSLNSVLVVSDNQPAFARISRVSFKSLQGLIDAPIDMVFDTAGDVESSPAGGDVSEAVASWSEQLASEIESSINYFASRNEQQPDTLVLSGIGARVRGISGHLQRRLQLSVRTQNPFTHLALPDKRMGAERSDGPEFAVALGLALRGLEG